MKVSNMTSLNSNRKIPNQFILSEGETEVFQSYKSIIVKRGYLTIEEANKNPHVKEWKSFNIYLDVNYWNYSSTTSKYRNMFLGETTKETKAKIANGEYVLVNLN